MNRQARARTASATPAERAVKVIEERERLIAEWSSQGRSPAEVRDLFRAHVEANMWKLVGGPKGLQRELARRRAIGLRFNTPESIRKRTISVRAQRRDAHGRFSKV